MRLVKSQTTDSRFFGGLRNKKVGVNVEPVSDRIDLVSTNAVVAPTGTTAERSNVPVEGMIRYNSTTSELEAYQNSAWRNIRYKESTTITRQNYVGNGDDVYGPLDDGSGTANFVPNTDGLVVILGNVWQVSGDHYNIRTQAEVTTGGAFEGNNAPYNDTGYYIQFTSDPPFGTNIRVYHNFDK